MKYEYATTEALLLDVAGNPELPEAVYPSQPSDWNHSNWRMCEVISHGSRVIWYWERIVG